MVTFTDLVSLMLTFFVLLFSMSSLQMDEWDAMTAFVKVCLVTTIDIARLMAGLLELRNIGRRRTAVVGSKDHEGVLGQALLV